MPHTHSEANMKRCQPEEKNREAERRESTEKETDQRCYRTDPGHETGQTGGREEEEERHLQTEPFESCPETTTHQHSRTIKSDASSACLRRRAQP